jgi:16S rRNA (cytidine1402-2'-O)-methyltransferase
MLGTLYVVSLPIGNLEDITLRAIKTLRQVDLIVAEDTRHTRRIVSRYHIKTPFSFSLYQGAENERVEPCLRLLKEGKHLALVSDAGTPLISDPGFPLVRAAVEAGITVIPIPGATAAITALVASGLATDRFVFAGAVPRKEGERAACFVALAGETRTVVLYESPHRLLETLEAVALVLPDRRLVVARELTKVHEEFLRGTAREISDVFAARGEVKGEVVLLIEGAAALPRGDGPARAEAILSLLREEGLSKTQCARVLAQAFDLTRNEAYRLVHRD